MNNIVDLYASRCLSLQSFQCHQTNFPCQPEIILADLSGNGIPNPEFHYSFTTEQSISMASSAMNITNNYDQPLQPASFSVIVCFSTRFLSFQPHLSPPGRAQLKKRTKVQTSITITRLIASSHAPGQGYREFIVVCTTQLNTTLYFWRGVMHCGALYFVLHLAWRW